MFSSWKLNALKCQSNGSESDGRKNKQEEEDADDLSDHMYEKLPNSDGRSCKCHSEPLMKLAKPPRISLTKRISKWRMECPGIGNFQSNRSVKTTEDATEDLQSNDSLCLKSGNKYRDKQIRNIPFANCAITTKVMTVNVEREDGSLGITLRGGFHRNSETSKPIIITYVKPDGPAARCETIQPGDRLLAVDGVSLHGSSLEDAQKLLKEPSATTLLTIEYNVNVLDSVEKASGPLLVEIEKSVFHKLGLTLFQTDGCIIVERILPGSMADRCGALHVGDEILAVNSMRVNGTSISLEDVMKALESEYPILRLEILPFYAGTGFLTCGSWKTRDTLESESSGMNSVKNLINRQNRNFKKSEPENRPDYKWTSLSPCGISGAEIALVHSETLYTTLTRENGSFGLQFVDAPDGSILINSVTPGGSAERSQCLHPGDRLLSIGDKHVGTDNLTAKEINKFLAGESDYLIPSSQLCLRTEFDVLDVIVPSSGIFMVKLVKRGSAGLGITMTASKASGFIVSEMKKGSIAHRSGSLLPGDRLLAINNIPLVNCSVEYAAHIFHQSPSIVTLKIQREENPSDVGICNRKITYTVDLQKYGGPLGITIAGSEEPSQPITISGLTAGGLAEQTGVIHVGDEILAINNHSLLDEPLSKAHLLLQNSSDLVTLKLSRPLIPVCRLPIDTSPVLPSSIDSAVESWDSSHLDLASSPDRQKPLKVPGMEERNSIASPQWKSPSPHEDSSCSKNYDEMSCNLSPSGDATNLKSINLAVLDKITSENLKIKQELDLLSIKLDEERKSKGESNLGEITQISRTDEDVSVEFSTGENPSFCPPAENSNAENLSISLKNGKKENHNVKICGNDVDGDFDKDNRGRESILTADFEKFQMTYLPQTRNWSANQYLGCEDSRESIRSEFLSCQLYEVTLFKDPVYEDFGFSVSDGLYEKGVFVNRIRKGGPADLSNVLKPYDRILQVNKTFTQDFDCCLTVPLIASAGDSLMLLVARNPGSTSGSDHV